MSVGPKPLMSLYQRGQVTALAPLHDDVYGRTLLVQYAIVVLDNVRVVQLTQQVHFWHKQLPKTPHHQWKDKKISVAHLCVQLCHFHRLKKNMENER